MFEARRRVPGLPIMVLSQYVEQIRRGDCCPVGGNGYLLTDRVSDVGRLVDAVRRVAAGGAVLVPVVVAHLLSRHAREEPLRVLTPRDLTLVRSAL